MGAVRKRVDDCRYAALEVVVPGRAGLSVGVGSDERVVVEGDAGAGVPAPALGCGAVG